MIKIKHKGNFAKTEMFLKHNLTMNKLRMLEKYAQEGVDALSSATPIDSGETANSWGYRITETKKGIKLSWINSNVVDGVPIAIIIQYGHATQNGSFVQGRDYINPAIRPVFDRISNNVWREVTK